MTTTTKMKPMTNKTTTTRSTATLLLATALALLPAFAIGKEPAKGGFTAKAANDEVHVVEHDDPEMAAAVVRARASLDEFLAAWRQPPAGAVDFAVKVGISQ